MTPFSTQALELAPWSVTKAKLVRSCPLAWKYKYRDHLPEDMPGLVTRVGRGAHSILERTTRGEALDAAIDAAKAEHGFSAEEMAGIARFLEGIRAFGATLARFRATTPIRRELCEEKVGLTAALEPAPFFGNNVFFRGAWDLGFLLEDLSAAVIDHKTGRKGDIKWHSAQLRAYALMALCHYPELKKVWLGIHFIGDAELVWAKPSSADVIRGQVRSWFVGWINDAAERASFPDPQPVVSRFCDFCSYRPICPAHNSIEAATERLVQLSAKRRRGAG